jgi:hypothetical protein
VFTTARHWSLLSCARWIQSTPSHPISHRSILMLSSHLCQSLPRTFRPCNCNTKCRPVCSKRFMSHKFKEQTNKQTNKLCKLWTWIDPILSKDTQTWLCHKISIVYTKANSSSVAIITVGVDILTFCTQAYNSCTEGYVCTFIRRKFIYTASQSLQPASYESCSMEHFTLSTKAIYNMENRELAHSNKYNWPSSKNLD